MTTKSDTASGTPPEHTAVTRGDGAAARPRRSNPDDPPNVPGYTLVRVIGHGGMGVVWEALEHRLDRLVALKVQAESRDPERVAQLWSEARLAAKVTDPGVVPVHDFGYTAEGDPFYTMDLVAGTDLRALMREGPLPRARALELASQIASAVGAAHDRGIVHRDLKPSNVLVDPSGRARVVDFGLAYDPTLGDAYVNALAGTPAYMAPEQVAGAPIGPSADVHAIGVMLYEMLTGVRPWGTEGGTEGIMARIVGEEPAPPSGHNGAVGPDLDDLCMRCLAKAPASRFPSASALAGEIEALRLGKSTAPPSLRPVRVEVAERTSAAPPSTERPEREEAPVHRRWSWALKSPPEKLWPYVSNTDRVNKAIGLQPVEFTDTIEPGAGAVRSGAFRAMGMQVEWREYPFEWVRGKEHTVFRRYRKGPIEALWNAVRLLPQASGGTELVHEVWVKPRGVMGRVATFLEVDQKTGKNLDALYRRIDACVLEGRDADPFEPRATPTTDQRKLTEGASRRLVAGGFDPELVAKLCLFVVCEPVKRVERMRPYELADAWGVDREGMLDLCLHAAYAGLLELSWDAICPRCRIAHESFPSLSRLSPATTCTPCDTRYERDLAESVEVVFRPHPDVRPASPTTYCTGAPALRPHVLVQQRVSPGERRQVTVDLPPGDYSVAGDWPGRSADLSSSPSGFMSEGEAVVRASAIDLRPAVVLAGKVTLGLSNDTDREQVIRVEAHGRAATGVTAAAVMTHPSFRELFSAELLSEADPVSVRRMAFLCLEVEGRGKLFAERGDAGAWAALRKLDAIVDATLRNQRGALVPAPLGVYAAAFSASARAVEAALEVIEAWAKEAPATRLRAGVHGGPCMAVSRGKRVEYFGRTVHRALSLLGDAAAGGLALSDAVASEREVAAVLRDRSLVGDVVRSERGPYAGSRIVRLVLAKASAATQGAPAPE